MLDRSDSLGRVKACTECRQQKLRCDAQKDYSKPCSRCNRLGLDCIVSHKFKRQKRQSKAELLKENARLKRQVSLNAGNCIPSIREEPASESRSTTTDGNSTAPTNSRVEVQPTNLSTANSVDTTSNRFLYNGLASDAATMPTTLPELYYPPPEWTCDVSSSPSAAPVMSSASLPLHNAFPSPVPSHSPTSSYHTQRSSLPRGSLAEPPTFVASSTNSRSLGDITLDGRKITDCFNLFFEHYAPSLPGLFDPTVSPDDVASQSPLLFWVIVCTGARRYRRDPTVFDRLSKRIIDLATSSVCFNPRPTPVIQAILILCLWRVPMRTIFKDPSHALAGAALQLAIQNGFHIISREVDFATKPIRQQTLVGPEAVKGVISRSIDGPIKIENEISFRARLWTHCLIVFQSTSILDGLPPTLVPEFSSLSKSSIMENMLPIDLAYRYNLHRLRMDAISEIRRKVDLEGLEPSNLLNSLIDIYDRLVVDFVPQKLGDLELFDHNCTRLLIRSFHFFEPSDRNNHRGFLDLFSISCNVIEIANRLHSDQDFKYLSNHDSRLVTLAAYCILRISKSHLKDYIATNKAEDMVFAAVEISRKLSVQDNDLDALTAVMLTKIWASNDVFTRSDGTRDSLRLHLRSRMAVSVIFDCFYWWRREYGTLSNTKNPTDESEMPNEKAREGFTSPSVHHDTSQPANLSQNMEELSNAALPYSAHNFFYSADWDWLSSMANTDYLSTQFPPVQL